MPDSPANLMVNVFDGTRQPLTTDEKLLIRVIDGNQKEQSAGFHNGPSVLFRNLPVFDNFGDNYTVIVSTAGYLDAGFTPVHIQKGTVQALDLMLLPRNSAFNFAGLTWAALPQKFPKLFELLSNDLPDQQLLVGGEWLAGSVEYIDHQACSRIRHIVLLPADTGPRRISGMPRR